MRREEMTTTRIDRVRSSLAVAAVLGVAGAASAQVLISDDFTDGDRTTNAGWFLAAGTGGITVGVADDSAGIGGGNALDVTMTTDSTRPIAAQFPDTTLANDGDTLSFSFTVRVTESPIDPSDGGAVTGDSDRRFRFGLYNNGGTPVVMDSNSSAMLGDDDVGYYAQIDIGTAAGNSYTAAGDQMDGLLSGSNVSLGATSTDPLAIDNTARQLGLALTRNGDVLDVAISFDGNVVQTGAASVADIATFGLPFTFNQVALGTSNASLDYRIDDVNVTFTGTPTVLPTTDGFEDGDRDNNGLPEGAVNDAADIGFTWYRSQGNGDFDVTVVDDAAGIGTANALRPFSSVASTRVVSAAIDPITLTQAGDQVSFSFDLRMVGTIPSSDRRWRFGIHNDGGTPVTTDGDGQAEDDPGYMAQFDTGPSSSSTATVRGDLPNGVLSGSTRSLGGTSELAQFALDDNDTHRLELRVRRAFDGDLGRDVNVVTLLFDGEIVTDGEDEGDGVSVTDPLTYTFNQISIGTSTVADVEYLIDNVEVLFIPLPTGDASTDGFEDGDRDNDGAAEGPINDISDTGFTWYKSTGQSSFDVDVIDDAAGIGTGNAVNHFSLTTSTRALSAAIDDVTLAAPGDSISFAFDFRLRGAIPDEDRRFRFGIHSDGGTPVTRDGGTTVTGDDPGYMAQFDLGDSIPGDTDDSATVRGDLPNGLLRGSTRSTGGTTDDLIYRLNTNDTRRLELRVTRDFDGTLGRDVNRIALFVDGVLATEGVDSGDPDNMLDTDPVTFDFNQISFGTNDVSFADILIDNVEVTVVSAPACPQDLTGDGILDYFDIALFLLRHGAMDPTTDLNGDTMFTAADINLYLIAFDAGCP